MASEQLKTAVIVEDDPDIRHLLVEVLEAAGFSTVSVGNGIDGIQAVLSYRPLLTTLDVNMPGIDGFEAARRIRAQSDTYIIMLTGLSEEADVVLGLGAGADEYIVKPFRPREFRARVDALLRRPRASAPQQTPQQDSVGPSFPGARSATPAPTPAPADGAPLSYEEYLARFPGATPAPAPAAPAAPQFPAQQPVYAPPPQQQRPAPPVHPASPPQQPIIVHRPGDAPAPSSGAELVVHQPAGELVPVTGEQWLSHRDLQVDTDTRLAYVAGRELDLTRTEFDLLSTLMASKRRVRSKADLTLVLRGESYVTSYFVGEADKRAIEAHMTNLRRKLADNPTTPRYIETVRGVGYRMTSEMAAPA